MTIDYKKNMDYYYLVS